MNEAIKGSKRFNPINADYELLIELEDPLRCYEDDPGADKRL